MLEQESTHQYTEIRSSGELWRYQSAGSVYAAEALSPNRFVIGGSTWDRRNTAFNDVTRNASGQLSDVVVDNDQIYELHRIEFPSMVNVILPLEDGIFVGCKRGERTCTTINGDFEIVRSIDDELGDGMYNAIFHRKSNTILAATRNGWLHAIDPVTLSVVRTTQLQYDNARLWSLAVREEDGSIFVGDYAGHVYCLSADLRLLHRFNITKYIQESLPKESRRYEPSIFGVAVTSHGQLVTSVRWGQLDWFDISESVIHHNQSVYMHEEISQISAIPGSAELLVGTRSGKLFIVGVSDDKYLRRQLLHIPPVYQTDNSVWSISCDNNLSVIVCFADGQVVRMELKGLIKDA